MKLFDALQCDTIILLVGSLGESKRNVSLFVFNKMIFYYRGTLFSLIFYYYTPCVNILFSGSDSSCLSARINARVK